MTKVQCPQVQTDRQRPFCRPSWFIGRRTKPVVELEREFDGSKPYMKFERNPIQND